MRPYFSQNLNERGGKVVGSMFWHGRASWEKFKRHFKLEWCFGPRARAFHFKANVNDDDTNLMLIAGIPWLFDFYFTIAGVFVRGMKEREFGFAIHNGAFWLYPGNWSNEWNSKDSWWKKNHAWHFPWNYNWYSTEILTLHTPRLAQSVFMDKKGHRIGDPFDGMRKKEEIAKQHQATYDYTYTCNNGEVQHRKATVHVERMVWRIKLWPLLPLKKVRTSISISFSDEVGEGSGTWKDGCTGCGYDMLDYETPWECLHRMEKERKFSR